jgi:hypothetical protein
MVASEQIADYLQIKRGDAILRMRWFWKKF